VRYAHANRRIVMANSNRILVKLRSAVALAAAAPCAHLRLLFEPAAPTGVLGVAAAPAWYLADGGPTPQDVAYARVADQLGSLAVQFGWAIGGRGALRDAIGTLNDDRVWTRHQPDLDPNLTFEIHELRRYIRIGPDGQHRPQIITALTQTRPLAVDGSPQPQMFRGGSTLVVDLSKPAIAYKITKRIDSATRQQRTAAFLRGTLADPLRALLLMPNRDEPFAALHSLADLGGF
jgi:hypothetical protein